MWWQVCVLYEGMGGLIIGASPDPIEPLSVPLQSAGT